MNQMEIHQPQPYPYQYAADHTGKHDHGGNFFLFKYWKHCHHCRPFYLEFRMSPSSTQICDEYQAAFGVPISIRVLAGNMLAEFRMSPSSTQICDEYQAAFGVPISICVLSRNNFPNYIISLIHTTLQYFPGVYSPIFTGIFRPFPAVKQLFRQISAPFDCRQFRAAGLSPEVPSGGSVLSPPDSVPQW